MAMSPMEILNPAVVDITPQGLTVDCIVSGPQLGLLEADEKYAGPLTIHLEVAKVEGPITVTGTLEGTALRQCVRCLTEYADPLSVSVYAEYMRQAGSSSKASVAAQPRGGKRREPGVEAAEEADKEEDEVYFYQGEHIDMAPMLREQIILSAPMQPLCREDCQGLCPQCGQNWNDRRCGCPPEQVPNPFRVLRDRSSKGGNA
jgi:uncharacterized protein